MISKNLSFVLIFSLIFVLNAISLQADPQWQANGRIEITITPKKPASYQGTNSQFLANPVYMQGEQATFDITFKQLPFKWFLWSKYVDIPDQNLLVTFPNQKEKLKIKRISTGHYKYVSPELVQVGNRNHTLSISVIIPPGFFNRNTQILTTNKCSISVARIPLNINITSPANGALLNTNPLTVTGTVDDNRAVVTVNNISAVVQNNQFTAQIPVIEGQNNITARARNRFGTTANSQISVTIDTIPPQNPSITIQQGDYTKNSNIILNLSAQGANEMAISENPQFPNPQWIAYATTTAYRLSSGDGRKTIYIKYRDHARNETQSVTDSIILDTTPPQIEITYPGNGIDIEGNEITVTGRYIEINLEKITVNGTEATFSEGLFSASDISLPIIGENTIIATAIDRAGNTTESSIDVSRTLTVTDILERLYNNFNLIQDMTADMTVSGTYNGQPYGNNTYAKFYYKKINKTKTEFFSDQNYQNREEIIIISGSIIHMVNPATGFVDTSDLKVQAGINEQQFTQMDITTNLEQFIEGHNINLIESESNHQEGLYTLEAIPNTPNTLYSRLKLQIDFNKGLLIKSELYKSNELMQTIENLQPEMFGEAWIAKQNREIILCDSKELITTSIYSNIIINQGLSDNVFDPERQ